jgi:hypothetical protein
MMDSTNLGHHFGNPQTFVDVMQGQGYSKESQLYFLSLYRRQFGRRMFELGQDKLYEQVLAKLEGRSPKKPQLTLVVANAA